MERMDWLHANFDSPVLIEEYIEGREMYVGVIGNDKPEALPVIELDLSKLPDGTPRIAAAEVKWGKGTKAYRDTKSAIADRPARGNGAAAAADRDRRVPGAGAARLRPRGHAAAAGRQVQVIEVNPNPWLSSRAEFAMAARKSGRTYPQLVEEIVELAMATRTSPTQALGLGPRAPDRIQAFATCPSALHEIQRPTSVRREVSTTRSQSPIAKLCDTMRAPGRSCFVRIGRSFTFKADSRYKASRPSRPRRRSSARPAHET